MAKLDPFKADEEDSTQEANQTAKAKLQERIAASEPDELPVEKPDDGEDPLDAAPAALTRDEKKRNRWKEHTQARERAEARAKELEDENRRLQVAAEVARQQAFQVQQQAQPRGPDPIDEDLKRSRREQEALYAEYVGRQKEGNLTPEAEEKFRQRAYDIKDRETQLQLQKFHRDNGISRQDPAEQHRQTVSSQIRMQFPDIVADARASAYADGVFRQLTALGRPNDWDTIEAAMKQTRRDLRMGNAEPSRRPNEAERQRYSGLPAGPGSSREDSPKTIRMTPGYKKMAEKLYRNDPPNIAHQKWANTVGKKLLNGDGA